MISLISCNKKENIKAYLTLVYNGATHTTLLLREKSNNEEVKHDVTYPKEYDKIQKGSDLQYSFEKEEDRINLKIEKVKDLKEIVDYVEAENEVVLNEDLKSEKVSTNLDEGKYIYIFSVDWKDKSAEYIKFIEIN